MSNLIFSAFQLIINQQKPNLDLFFEVEEEQYTTKENTYKINIKKIDNRFLWMHVRFGGSLPYSQEVVDTNSDEIIPNPRQLNHVELNQQLFCLYDTEEYYFYISNSKKKSFLEGYFKEKLKEDCIIKRFFKSPQDFLKHIKTINKVSFTSKHNIFSTQSGLFDDMKDIFGLGQPENFKIDINYNGIEITNKFQEIFNKFLTKNDNREIQSLVCIGKDDKDIESIFDITSFTKTRSFNLKKDSWGIFDIEAVRQNIINSILEIKNV